MTKPANEGLRDRLAFWLIDEPPTKEILLYDFNRLKYEIRQGDVLLIEGRSRIARIIRSITQSPWTHAALYIGRLIDFEDQELRQTIKKNVGSEIDDNTRLIVEGLLDKGSVISPLSLYRDHHIRICRPIGITESDMQSVIRYSILSVGKPYNIRHFLDLARFILPWKFLPRRWGSCLFRTSSGEPESGICSSLIAEAFTSVQFPILPYIKPYEDSLEIFQRNPHLYTPKDFDYSPYFEIIKYPLFNPEEPLPYYRRLPWSKSGMLHQDDGILAEPNVPKKPGFNIFGKKKKENSEKEIIKDKEYSDKDE